MRHDAGDAVGGISFARAVAPRAGFKALVAQPLADVNRRDYPAVETPINDPIRYVTAAAARPMPS